MRSTHLALPVRGNLTGEKQTSGTVPQPQQRGFTQPVLQPTTTSVHQWRAVQMVPPVFTEVRTIGHEKNDLDPKGGNSDHSEAGLVTRSQLQVGHERPVPAVSLQPESFFGEKAPFWATN